MSSRVNHTAKLAVGMGLGFILTACSSGDRGGAIVPQPPPAPITAGLAHQSGTSSGIGLVPLPSPQQVAASVALGRLDPFSDPSSPSSSAARSLPAAGSADQRGSGTPAPAAVLPADFVFTGVIVSAGRAEAMVQTAAASNAVRVGEVGGPGKPWLPRGWKVEAIDVQQGRLTLRQGRAVRVLKLS
ncbi:MAG: hypothetical protein ACKOZT_07950 [Cyanobium sp.]